MAEQDDFHGFWTINSYPSPSSDHHHQINGQGPIFTDDDDEWGEFIAPPGSDPIRHQSNGFSHSQASNHIGPFEVSRNINVSNSITPPSTTARVVDSGPIKVERHKGPLPLSIFGEIEEDEEGGDPAGESLVAHNLLKGVDLDRGSGVGNLFGESRKSDQQIKPPIGFDPNFNGSGSDLGLDRDSGEGDEGIDDDDDVDVDADDGWEFKGALSDQHSVGFGEVITNREKQGTFSMVDSKSGFNHSLYGFGDLFAVDKSSRSDRGFDFEPTIVFPNGSMLFHVSQAESLEKENGKCSTSMDDNGNFDEFEDFIVARSEIGTTDQEAQNISSLKTFDAHLPNGKVHEEQKFTPEDSSKMLNGEVQSVPLKRENSNGALPLSLFSDSAVDFDDDHGDVLIQKLPSDSNKSISNQGSGVSIHDLVLTLYSEPPPNGRVMHSSSINPGSIPSRNTVQPFEVLNSSMENGDGSFDDDSWEFKDSSSETGVKQQPLSPERGVAQHFSTESSNLQAHVNLYTKLRDELCLFVYEHLDSLKRMQKVNSDLCKDGKAEDLDKEIQEATEMLKDSVLSEGGHADEKFLRKSHLDQILEHLRAPEFQVLESEYQISEKLQLAQKDRRSAIKFLRHVKTVLKVLTLASEQEQLAYLSTWARIVASCAQELRHGTLIWKQAFENNLHGQMLSNPRGQKHIQALSEIYRVVQLFGLSAKLYKPWILLNSANSIKIFPLLDECDALWSLLGLEECLENVLDAVDSRSCEPIMELIKSIKHIRDTSVLSMLDLDFTIPGSICQMTLLPSGILSGLKTVIWNGRLCFLNVGNLWANLVSFESPELPCLCG